MIRGIREEAVIELDGRFAPTRWPAWPDFPISRWCSTSTRLPTAEINTGARHPRGRTDWPLVGIFAQRGKARPNRIGVSICRLLSVEGLRLKVRGLDAIDGTPVLDIKPVMKGFLPRGEIVEPALGKRTDEGYW